MDPKLRGVSATPNDLSPELAAMCRALATTSAMDMMYLVDYFIADWHGANPFEFATYLFKTNQDPQHWDYVDTLFMYPDIKSSDWSSVTAMNYMAACQSIPGERWILSKLPTPSLTATRYQVGSVSKNLRYYEIPRREGFIGSIVLKGSPSENFFHLANDQVPNAIRRLLAKRLGWNARSLLLDPGALISVDGLVRAANINVATMSADAKQALEAIVVEMDGIGGPIEKADRCVGEGPDELYR